MNPHDHRRRAVALIAALGLAALAAPAAATEGSLYPRGASIWGVNSPFVVETSGTAMLVRQHSQATVPAGNVWEMNWGCDVPGTEVGRVRFGILRTAASSSMEVRVTGNRQRLWGIPDASIPRSPAGGAVHSVDLPPGQCNVHLALTQTEARSQHARTYFVDAPSAYLRDLTAPAVTLTHLSGGWYGTAARPLTVGWSTSDNFGSDGMGLQEILVGGARVWAGSPGQGSHAVDASVPVLPDGTHQVVVRVSGDGTPAGTATGTVRVDRTAPVAAANTPVHTGALRETFLSWTTGDALSGVASSRAQVLAGGQWITLAEADGSPQARAITVPGSVPEGVHPWRVSVTDNAGNTGTKAGTGSILVDTTPPTLAIHATPPGWTRAADADITIGDNLADALGLGATEIDVNTATDGSTGGRWHRATAQVRAAGRSVVPVPLDGLDDGVHVARVTVRNGGPFGDRLTTAETFPLRIDRTPPVVGAVTFGQPESGLLRASWTADDAASGIARVTVQRFDGQRWRTLAEQPASQGTGSLIADLSAVASGTHRFRVVAADAAGNTHAGEGQLTVDRSGAPAARAGQPSAPATDPGAASDAEDPFARLRTARISVSMPGARVTRRADGRTVMVRTLRLGARTPLVARLVDARGQAIGGAEIEARGHRGVAIARGRTGADGRVRLTLRPEAGALVRVGVPAGGALLPARTRTEARVRVRPRVVLRRVAGPVRTGERVMFTGRIYPAPSRLGLRARKGVVLEWRDPLRGAWRPVVNAPVRRDGTFSIPWRFNLRGLAVPMRARVPAEIGWPLMPGLSRPIKVVPR